jgi:hypothetical protein
LKKQARLLLIENCEKNEDLSEKDWLKLKNHRSKLGIIHTALVDPFSVLKPHEISVRLNEIKEFKEGTDKMTKDLKILKAIFTSIGILKMANGNRLRFGMKNKKASYIQKRKLQDILFNKLLLPLGY